MKLTFIFLTIATMGAHASGHSQSVSFSGNEVSLKKVFEAIKLQTGYSAFYNKGLMRKAEPVTISANDMPLKDFLALMFTRQPLNFRIDDKTIVLSEKPKPEIRALATIDLLIPPVEISGTIRGTDGAPLAAVSIRIKGKTGGTVTDAQGGFSLASDIPDNAVLEVSSVGYEPVEVTIRRSGSSYSATAVDAEQAANIQVAGGQRLVINITLNAATSNLDEVVFVGYGTVKKRDLTGAVSSVRSDDIKMAPVPNAIEALQGRVAGLDIARSDGRSTSSSSILLRGNRSLTAGSDPIYIIDGIQGDITTLNPNDIEAIDVLKDASSTAIYGSAGANGVIIVTTKQAKKGKVQVDFDAYAGINSNGRYPSALMGDAWLKYLEESYKSTNNGQAPANRDELLTAWSLDPNKISGYIDDGQWIDWIDQTLHTGVQQNYNVTIRGGTDKTQGYFSLGYNSTQGIYKDDQARMYTLRAGVTNKVANWLTAGVQTRLSWKDNDSRASRINKTFSTVPLGEVYDDAGNINPYPIDGMTNVVSLIADDVPNTYENNSKNINLVVNPYVELNLAPGLTFKSILGTTLSGGRTGTFNSDHTYMMLTGSSAQVRNATYATSLGYGYIWENIANYSRTFAGDHDFSATVISSWTHNQRESSSSYNEGFLYDNYLYYGLVGTNPATSASYSMGKKMSVAGRINYAYKGKYLFSLSNRTDGVSQLALRWDSFLAGAAAWRISDENFMDGTRGWLSNLKIRAGYGVSGNSGIAAYSTATEVTGTGLDQINLGGGVLTTSVLTETVGNPNLTWEKSYNLNIGLDFGLFNNRIDGSIEWYDTDTRDVLYARALPYSGGGFTAKLPYKMTDNIARMHNRGIEVTLNTVNVKTADFSWHSTITFAANKEQVKSIDLGSGTTVDDLVSLGLFLGHPKNTIFGIKKLGIWQLGEEEDAAVFGLKPGDVRAQSDLTQVGKGVWVDNTVDVPVEYTADNPYKISAKDRVIYGQGTPKWTAGWQNSFYYKNFDLNVFATARWGYMINAELLGYFKYNTVNIPENYKYWTPENPTNDFPRPYLTRTTNFSSPTDGLSVVDASYIKIKNITLGYTLPDRLWNNLGLSRLRVYATMYNPIIITKSHLLKDADPETGASDSFPLYRQMVFGLNLSL